MDCNHCWKSGLASAVSACSQRWNQSSMERRWRRRCRALFRHMSWHQPATCARTRTQNMIADCPKVERLLESILIAWCLEPVDASKELHEGRRDQWTHRSCLKRCCGWHCEVLCTRSVRDITWEDCLGSPQGRPAPETGRSQGPVPRPEGASAPPVALVCASGRFMLMCFMSAGHRMLACI